ncbi:MAG: rod shape-determining protein MreC [Bacteroidales bacterium]|nr:MAG: rod shape-determining protein MreC [Bacteroidales bacterium]
MRNLLDFLIKYSKWFLFIIYVIISCMLLFNNNPYQHYIYLTSANKVSSLVFKTSGMVTSYFHLHDINEDLQRQNASLESEVIWLRKQLALRQEEITADSIARDSSLRQFDFILAHVISNSVSRVNNYITIEKGRLDSVKPEMGVVDQNGVVGIVNIVGDRSARVISLLNPEMRLSCKVKGREYFGSLVWDGKSPHEALLEEMPRHEKFKKGDTIVTSGYSAVFPEGIPVGTIISHEKEHDDNFYALRIKLFTDFTTLSTVRVIRNNMKDELMSIQAGEEND